MYTPELCMGWQRDLPDFRDHTKQADGVAKILSKSKRLQAAIKKNAGIYRFTTVVFTY